MLPATCDVPQPDVRFLRNTGMALGLLALGAGVATLTGTYAIAEAPLQIEEARSLAVGTESLLRDVDRNVSREVVFTMYLPPSAGDD